MTSTWETVENNGFYIEDRIGRRCGYCGNDISVPYEPEDADVWEGTFCSEICLKLCLEEQEERDYLA